MAQKLYDDTKVQAIANAIRTVNGKDATTVKYKIADMADAITGIKKTLTVNITNGTVIKGSEAIYENNTIRLVITPSSGYTLPDTVTVTNATQSYNKTTGILELSAPTGNVTVTISCPAEVTTVDFLTCAWSEISTWATNLENGSITTAQFCAHFLNGSTVISSMDEFVGLERTVTVNSKDHIVRVIGTQHSTDLIVESGAVTTKKAALTFEFKNLISDANGFSLASYWKNTNDTSSANYDYLNSDMRKVTDGEGSGAIHWFEKDSKTWSTTYTGSILSMLPTELSNVLKTVQKSVGIHNGTTYALQNYNSKLFNLSYREMTATSSSYALEEGTTYAYYNDSTTEQSRRIKQQVNGITGARTSSLSGSDLDGAYTGTKYSYAGYNHSTATNGGYCWLRSPNSYYTSSAWNVNIAGNLNSSYNYYVYDVARGVSPAFCI